MSSNINLTTYDWLSAFVSSKVDKKEAEMREARFFEWIERITETNIYSIENGITGAAWLVIYFTRKSYIDVNIKEYFEELDDTIFRHTINVLAKNSDIIQILQLITYYQNRLSLDNSSTYYRLIPLSRCLKLLIDEAQNHLLDPNCRISISVEILFKFSALFGKFIHETHRQDCFFSKMENAILYFKEQSINPENCDDCMLSNVLKLAICGKQYGNPHWVDELYSIISKMPQPSFNKEPLNYFFSVMECYSTLNTDVLKNMNFKNNAIGNKALFELITNVKLFDASII